MTPPEAGLIASFRRTVQPLVHPPQAVHAARISRVRVVHDAVLQRERAHARPLASVRRRVGARRRRDLADDSTVAALLELVLAPIVVLEAALALLLLGELDAEVVIEARAERRSPR